MTHWSIWLVLTLICLMIQASFSMVEMAALSFSRVKLEYLANKGVKQAVWLRHLMRNPSRLFGTVMLGVNSALQIGSQSAREFYKACHLDPDIAPFTQILIVVIVAELAPLMAARRSSEQVIMWLTPVVYALNRLFMPFINLLSYLTRLIYFLLRKSEKDYNTLLSREELQKSLETHHNEPHELNLVISNIFNLRSQTAQQVMTPLRLVEMLPAGATVADFRKKISLSTHSFLPLYQKKRSQIEAIAYIKDYMSTGELSEVKERAHPPWFINTSMKLTHILHNFRRNKEEVAVVLNHQGRAVGLLTLDAILEEVTGSNLKPRTS